MALEHRTTGGGEGRQMGRLASGHEGERGVGRQAQNVLQPGPRDLLDRRRRRCRERETGVLVPGRDEPVCRERCRQRAADHEPEVATRSHRGQPRLRVAGELGDHRRRVRGSRRHRPSERDAHLRHRGGRGDAAPGDGLDPVCGELRRLVQQVALVLHPGHLAREQPLEPVGIVERTDHRELQLRAHDILRDPLDVLGGDGVEPGEDCFRLFGGPRAGPLDAGRT